MISPISRTVLGFHAVEAEDFWEGRDLEETMAFGGICETKWLMNDAAAFARFPFKGADLFLVVWMKESSSNRVREF